MADDFKKKITEDFGLGKLPVSDQEKMIERIGNILFEAIIERSIDEMDQSSIEDFENLMASVGSDYQKVVEFLKARTPNFQAIVSDEMTRLKKAAAGIFA